MKEVLSGWLEDWRARAGDRWWWPLGGVALLGAGIVIWVLARSGEGAEQAAAPAAPPVASAGESPDAPPAPSTPPASAAPPPSSTGTAPPSPAAAAAAVDAGPLPSPNVKLTFRTFPARPATVTWGSKRLGVIDRNKPLVIERPRDSGPIDVIVRSVGFIPVHTRAYTFTDSNIDVKITPLEKKDTLYGYKEPIVDAGVPFPVEAPEVP